jgi:hypothetical protein
MAASFTDAVINNNDVGVAVFQAVASVLLEIQFFWFVTPCNV